MTQKSIPAIDRFNQRYIPEPNSGCWLWTAGASAGYGRFNIDGSNINGAHQFSYKYFKGKIPEGMFVCHKCDTRCCVNPDHLFLGDQKINAQDAMRKGRLATGKTHYNGAKTHCRNGHEFTFDNTYIGSKGGRVCKTCRAAQARQYMAKLRAQGFIR